MTIAAILADLTRRGIRLWTVQDKLRYSPKSAVSPELPANMASLKAELLDAGVEGFGRVPARWSRGGWRKHLLDLSEACERLHPQRAEYFRKWAGALEST